MQLNIHQARLLVSLFGDDDCELTVEYRDHGYGGPGLYAWSTDYPDDGEVLLDPVIPDKKEAAEKENLRRLLLRISQWDGLDTAADGAYWRREIAAIVGDVPADASEANS
jgi:hypothetical protein